MNVHDLFAPTGVDEWFNDVDEPRVEVIRRLRLQPIPDDDDLETARTLADLVHAELLEYGTKAEVQRLNEDQVATTILTLRSVLSRHGIDLELPWRDYTGFRTYWTQHGASGRWQSRREILAQFFDPVFDKLTRLEDARMAAALAEPVSPASKTGWPEVDRAVHDVRERFRSAATAADYSDVGRRCVALLETLSATVYDTQSHLRAGESEPPVAKTHIRIGRYIEDSLEGPGNAELRALIRKAAEFAEAVKHRSTSTRRDAGIAADAVVLLANILRRAEPDQDA